MMISLFLAGVLASGQIDPAPPSSTPPTSDPQVSLSAENRAAIRCSAAFAIVGARQAQGAEAGEGTQSQWPELRERGREFFVVAMAGLMDERGFDRAMIEKLTRDAALRLREAGEVDAVMPACLLMLEASGV